MTNLRRITFILISGISITSCIDIKNNQKEIIVVNEVDKQVDTKIDLQKIELDKVFDFVDEYLDNIGKEYCLLKNTTVSNNPYEITVYNRWKKSLDDEVSLNFYPTPTDPFYNSVTITGNNTRYFPHFLPFRIGDSLASVYNLYGEMDNEGTDYCNAYYDDSFGYFISLIDNDDDKMIDGIEIGYIGW